MSENKRPWIDIAWAAMLLSASLALLVLIADHFHFKYAWIAAPYLHPIFHTTLAYRSTQDPFYFMIECAFLAWAVLFALLLTLLRKQGMRLSLCVLLLAGSYALYSVADGMHWESLFQQVENCQISGGAWDWKLDVCGEKQPSK